MRTSDLDQKTKHSYPLVCEWKPIEDIKSMHSWWVSKYYNSWLLAYKALKSTKTRMTTSTAMTGFEPGSSLCTTYGMPYGMPLPSRLLESRTFEEYVFDTFFDDREPWDQVMEMEATEATECDEQEREERRVKWLYDEFKSEDSIDALKCTFTT